MKLYNILFEEEEKKVKKFTSFTPPDFALHVDEGNNSLTLIHVESLKKMLKTQHVKKDSMLETCAGMIELKDSDNQCLGAMQVGLIAGSPKWPGAGTTIYALASDYYGSPLTSDRGHSSSVAAREIWAKIEKNSEWKKVGDGLDNYANVNNKKVYMDIKGTYPQRTLNPKTNSSTAEEIDDCPLPTKGGSITDPEKMSELLGTADAYRYTGSLKAQPLIAHFEKIRDELSSKEENPMGINLDALVKSLSTELFKYRYKGSGTTR